jgi:hypothetical protein
MAWKRTPFDSFGYLIAGNRSLLFPDSGSLILDYGGEFNFAQAMIT